jgi:hypothetical protein
MKQRTTYWRIKKANKEYTCVLCGESIGRKEEYIAPRPRPRRGLNALVSPPHRTTFREKPPYFHVDCFQNLKRRYKPERKVERLIKGKWKKINILRYRPSQRG